MYLENSYSPTSSPFKSSTAISFLWSVASKWARRRSAAARVMADTDLLADLNKVRKVRADVEQVIPLSVST